MAIPVGKLFDRLKDPAHSGVYRVSDGSDIQAALEAAKRDVAVVELAYGKDAMLASVAQALGFPDWFGGNWDALEDCLTDLSWRNGSERVIFFRAAVPDDDLGILVDVLSSAAAFWRGRRKVFVAIFVDPDKKLKLPDLRKAMAG